MGGAFSNRGAVWTEATHGIRRAGALVIVLLVLVMARPTAAAIDLPAVEQSVVWIQAGPNSNPGAGVVIKTGDGKVLILTAYHVVEDAWNARTRRYTVDVRFRGQFGPPAKGFLAREMLWPDDDLALVEVKRESTPKVIPMGTAAGLEKLDEVIAIGHPTGFTWAPTKGEVTNFEGRHILFSGAAVHPGNSGGPLLDSNGLMVGLIVNERGISGQAVKAEYIHLVVKDWVGKEQPPAPATPRRPGSPADLRATAVGPTQVKLSWRDTSDDEEGFRIERKSSGESGFRVIASVDSNRISHYDRDLRSGKRYEYRVRAFNAAGDSDASSVASVRMSDPTWANASGFLAMREANVDSVDDIGGLKICGDQRSLGYLRESTVSSRFTAAQVSSAELYVALQTGACDAAVVFSADWRKLRDFYSQSRLEQVTRRLILLP